MATTIRDNFQGAVGYVGSDGIIRDRFNMKMGFVDESGIVYDRFRLKNGSVNAEGMIYNRTGQKLGWVEADTLKVRAMTGLKVGSVKDVEETSLMYAAAGALVTLLLKAYDKRKTLVDS
jgi:hypothetical protein